MLKEEFETRLANFIFNTTLFTLGKHITNLNYLKNELFCFRKLLDSNMEELNKILEELDNIAIISNNDKKHLLDLFDLEVK